MCGVGGERQKTDREMFDGVLNLGLLIAKIIVLLEY